MSNLSPMARPCPIVKYRIIGSLSSVTALLKLDVLQLKAIKRWRLLRLRCRAATPSQADIANQVPAAPMTNNDSTGINALR